MAGSFTDEDVRPELEELNKVAIVVNHPTNVMINDVIVTPTAQEW
ncbi:MULTISPECIES: hypothetical protein [unclassified Bacillus (in: firmicutes)]|nr:MULTISPECIES: hypothetical protein [unclassified Bacillus (in: firmicutes)]